MVDLRAALANAEHLIQFHLSEMHASGNYILGPQTERFEQEFASVVGGLEAIGVGSGTAAIELCLRAAGIGDGPRTGCDCDVIVPAMTSLFTAQAVLATGAQLRIADVAPGDLLLTADSVAEAWTPQTRAVVAVHLYGQPCALDALERLCRERDAVLVQDACQAHGARFQGRPLSDYSPYTAYSFYPTKNLGALGDGGAVVTSDPRIAERVRLLRDGGRRGDQIARMPGINSRLSEMQACYLRAFLPSLGQWNERRRELAHRYREGLCGSGVQVLHFGEDSVNHLLVVRTPRRDALRSHLAERGVHTGIHYPVPIHEQPGLRPFSSWAAEPVCAATAAKEILSLPVAPHLTDEMVDFVIGSILEFT